MRLRVFCYISVFAFIDSQFYDSIFDGSLHTVKIHIIKYGHTSHPLTDIQLRNTWGKDNPTRTGI
ncbi:hypothetical protein HNR39_001556 [Glaciimonas immobilis]|uniref:Uncharacterized protein n=1 Tax=Glaciimonas immobilis TaxID=728004 RepID=A0A840RSR3_9BURK|nr:hypothetical protein [Glaciimonas immobilis]